MKTGVLLALIRALVDRHCGEMPSLAKEEHRLTRLVVAVILREMVETRPNLDRTKKAALLELLETASSPQDAGEKSYMEALPGLRDVGVVTDDSMTELVKNVHQAVQVALAA